MQRVERALGVTAQIRRWARAIEDQWIRNVIGSLRWIIGVGGRVETFIGDSPSLELRKERLEPIRMLVIDRERLLCRQRDAHVVLVFVITRHETNPALRPEVTGFGGLLQIPHTSPASRAFTGPAGPTCHPAGR